MAPSKEIHGFNDVFYVQYGVSEDSRGITHEEALLTHWQSYGDSHYFLTPKHVKLRRALKFGCGEAEVRFYVQRDFNNRINLVEISKTALSLGLSDEKRHILDVKSRPKRGEKVDLSGIFSKNKCPEVGHLQATVLGYSRDALADSSQIQKKTHGRSKERDGYAYVLVKDSSRKFTQGSSGGVVKFENGVLGIINGGTRSIVLGIIGGTRSMDNEQIMEISLLP